ncbi:MAG: sigma-54 dependent transcriptional regulator [Verrucomicrobiota bacterium]
MALEKILLLDDDSMVRGVVSELLREMGYQILAMTNTRQARQHLANEEVDLLITDLHLESENGIDFLKEVRKSHQQLPMMIITGFSSVDSAIDALHLGVADYLVKPIDYQRLELAMYRLEQTMALEAENQYLRAEAASTSLGGPEFFWGASDGMQAVQKMIQKISSTETTVLIQGESGTGKEVVARSLHQSSRRAEKPFISVNCAAIPANLLESEFFGHEKGAFTGAVSRRAGRFEIADGGTLLLDEVSEIPPELQVKLLRVLQEREFERVGGAKSMKVDVNVIATTNRDLATEIREGRFREDLYYRLNVVPIVIPPLRDRGDDLIALVQFFIERFARKHGKNILPPGPDLMIQLQTYDWPGNVRELQNSIERAVILSNEEGALQASDFPSRRSGKVGDPEKQLMTMEEMEFQMIQKALQRYQGNRTHAAKALSISLRTMRNKISRYKEEGRSIDSA